MARSAYRWQGWRTNTSGATIRDSPKQAKRKSKPKGISNAQAKYLADLQRRAGERYTGSGTTSLEASREIARLVEGASKKKR